MQARQGAAWPPKYDLLGVAMSAARYEDAMAPVINQARCVHAACVTHLAVHGLVEGSADPMLREMLNAFDIVAPDGQPVRIALNILYGTGLKDRCYGPEFMVRVCERSAQEGIGIYLYGSTARVVETLRDKLTARFPGLRVVGCEPSVFHPLTEEQDAALVQRMNESGAGILFLGLGCPLQEKMAYAHRDRVRAVQICVGAAFDFLSGNKKMAPAWMQRHALEWLYRLVQEPRRLFWRYFRTNTLFLVKFFLQWSGLKKYPAIEDAASAPSPGAGPDDARGG